MGCQLIGRWRIIEADMWERDYLDLVEDAFMSIGADGHGEIAFGAMQAGLDLEYSRTLVFFTWAGFDEMDEVWGSGSAELQDDGTLEIELSFHGGDDAVLKAHIPKCLTHLWMPPVMQVEFERFAHMIGCGHLSGIMVRL